MSCLTELLLLLSPPLPYTGQREVLPSGQDSAGPGGGAAPGQQAGGLPHWPCAIQQGRRATQWEPECCSSILRCCCSTSAATTHR